MKKKESLSGIEQVSHRPVIVQTKNSDLQKQFKFCNHSYSLPTANNYYPRDKLPIFLSIRGIV